MGAELEIPLVDNSNSNDRSGGQVVDEDQGNAPLAEASKVVASSEPITMRTIRQPPPSLTVTAP